MAEQANMHQFLKSFLNISGDGEVFTWGRGTHGQLGHGNLENIPRPKSVKFFENSTITCVSTGWNHSGFATGLQILKPYFFTSI
jgi:alpha-tubulin suppressor-like RCC1 family protein